MFPVALLQHLWGLLTVSCCDLAETTHITLRTRGVTGHGEGDSYTDPAVLSLSIKTAKQV